MTEQAWIRSHVEKLLETIWDVCRVVPDDDGDYAFRHGTAACWVAVLDTAPVMVRVYGHAASGLTPSFRLFSELNDIERRTLSCSVVLEEGPEEATVVVAQTLSPVGLTVPGLAQAVRAVGGVADDIGVLLAALYDGQTPYPFDLAHGYRDAPPGTVGPF